MCVQIKEKGENINLVQGGGVKVSECELKWEWSHLRFSCLLGDVSVVFELGIFK